MTLVRFDQLPAGVQPIKDYPSLDATLVECDHAAPLVMTTRDHARRVMLCPVCKYTWTEMPGTCVDPPAVKMLAIVPEVGALF